MFGMPGMGGMGGFHMQGHDDEDADEGNLYDILGVEKDATSEQIKEAYEKLEQEYKNAEEPDLEKLEEIKAAYEVLSNPQVRQMYDQQGSSHEDDMMQMFFGGGGHPKGPAQQQKSQPLKQLLQLTLEQSYTGDTIKVPVKRYRLCKTCNGERGADVKKCGSCKGQGQVVKVIPIGPGMMQQVVQPCQPCQGEGQIVPEESKCKDCQAKRVALEEVTVQAKVPKGIGSQQAIVVANQGHHLPDSLPGDLILVTKVAPHQIFARQGNDNNLLFQKDISLIQGIIGVHFNLTHLDGKVYTIQGSHQEIIGDKQKKLVRGLGMPIYKDPEEYGDLVVEFHLTMPEKGSITASSVKQLANILPGGLCQKPKDHHFQLLEDFDSAQLNTNQQGGGGNQDEEDEGQSQGVQCASQ